MDKGHSKKKRNRGKSKCPLLPPPFPPPTNYYDNDENGNQILQEQPHSSGGYGVITTLTAMLSMYLTNFHNFVTTSGKAFMGTILHKVWIAFNVVVKIESRKSFILATRTKRRKMKVQVIPINSSTSYKVQLNMPTWNHFRCLTDTVFSGITSSFESTAQLVYDRLVGLVGLLTAIPLKSLPRFLFAFLRQVVKLPVIVWLKVNAGNVLRRLNKRSIKLFKRDKNVRRVRFSEWSGERRMASSSSPSPSLSPASSVSLSPPPGPTTWDDNVGAVPWSSSSVNARRGGNMPPPPKGHAVFKVVTSSNMMECQMDWIQDFMPQYLSSDEKNKLIREIIRRLQEKLEDIRGRICNAGTELTMSLMLACFHAYLFEFNMAMDWINTAVDNMTTLTDDNRLHVRAYSYLVQACFYKINRRMKLMEGVSMKLVEEGAKQDVKAIEELFSEDEAPFQAALSLSKGVLAGLMVHQEKQIELYKNATELEPLCDQWQRALYQALRKKRRGVRSSFNPSFEERQAITKAYNLDPDCCLNQSLYASMLEERMKSNRDLILAQSKEDMGNEIVSLMVSALDKNPEDQWSHVRLAEIYAYGSFPHLDPKEGERMFEDLDRRWPNHTTILHKFGKYFVVTQNRPSMALEYYTRALEADFGNIPCLMDYLKTSQRLGKGYQFMLEMVEKCLGLKCLFNPAPFARVMLAKGILLWLLDDSNLEGGTGKQEACQVWIDAVERDTKSSGFIAKIITSGNWIVVGEFSIDIPQVLGILSVFHSMANSQRNLDQMKAITCLVDELERKSQPSFRGRQRSRYPSSCSSRSLSSLSNCSYVTARSSFSQADGINNWRESSPHLPPLVGGTGVFAKYEDPMDLRVRGRLNDGFKIGLTNVVPPPPQQNGRPKKAAYAPTPSVADLDCNWRR